MSHNLRGTERGSSTESSIYELLESLRSTPTRDPITVARGRAAVLAEAAAIRHELQTKRSRGLARWLGLLFRRRQAKSREEGESYTFVYTVPASAPRPAYASFLAVLATVFISASIVLAAQHSLPHELLYPAKTWTEDVRLALTNDPVGRFDLLIRFVNRRSAELTTLRQMQVHPPADFIARFESQVDTALQLADANARQGVPQNAATLARLRELRATVVPAPTMVRTRSAKPSPADERGGTAAMPVIVPAVMTPQPPVTVAPGMSRSLPDSSSESSPPGSTVHLPTPATRPRHVVQQSAPESRSVLGSVLGDEPNPAPPVVSNDDPGHVAVLATPDRVSQVPAPAQPTPVATVAPSLPTTIPSLPAPLPTQPAPTATTPVPQIPTPTQPAPQAPTATQPAPTATPVPQAPTATQPALTATPVPQIPTPTQPAAPAPLPTQPALTATPAPQIPTPTQTAPQAPTATPAPTAVAPMVPVVPVPTVVDRTLPLVPMPENPLPLLPPLSPQLPTPMPIPIPVAPIFPAAVDDAFATVEVGVTPEVSE